MLGLRPNISDAGPHPADEAISLDRADLRASSDHSRRGSRGWRSALLLRHPHPRLLVHVSNWSGDVFSRRNFLHALGHVLLGDGAGIGNKNEVVARNWIVNSVVVELDDDFCMRGLGRKPDH